MIDDLLLPEPARADSSEKAIFFRLAEENYKRRISFIKELRRRGADVILLRAKLIRNDAPLSFEYLESEGVCSLFIKIPAGRRKSYLRLRELFQFGTAVFENSPGLSGIFSPDIVLSGGVLPFSVAAGAKIAEGAGAVFISELSCHSRALSNLSLAGKFGPVSGCLKKNVDAAFSKSHGVLTFFPKAGEIFSGAHNLYPMVFPHLPEREKPSEKALFQREMLASFREGKTFVLAYSGSLEDGYSIEELILSAGTFGNGFALVFLSEGIKKPYFKRFVAERGITNVFFVDDAPKGEESFFLSGADGIFVSESDLGKGLFPPEEAFWNALGAQKPVIAASAHCSDFFRRAGGVIITKPRRRDSITLGIKTLMEMSEHDRLTLGRVNREFFEKNSPENFSEEVFSLFENFVTQKEI